MFKQLEKGSLKFNVQFLKYFFKMSAKKVLWVKLLKLLKQYQVINPLPFHHFIHKSDIQQITSET